MYGGGLSLFFSTVLRFHPCAGSKEGAGGASVRTLSEPPLRITLLAVCLFCFCHPLLADRSSVTLSPSSLNFGTQNVATTSGAGSASLTNHLSAALSISSITISGDFTQTNDCGAYLNPGWTCNMKVYFSPTMVGTRTGTLAVYDSDATSPQTVALSGSGTVSGLASIAVTPANPSVQLGLQQQFSAIGYYKNGTSALLTTSVAWTSSAASVAAISNTVGSQGLASTLAQGSTMITATLGGITGSTLLTITPPVLLSIAVTPSSATVLLGGSLQFTATGTYSDGSQQDLTNTATWISSLTTVATVSQGLATPIHTGTATITASVGSVSGSATLTVLAVLSLSVQPTNLALAQGQTQQLGAAAEYSDGSFHNVTATATWSSSSPSIASVNSGLVTAVSPGTATITASLDAPNFPVGQLRASAAVRVFPPVIAQVALTPASASVLVGTGQQFSAVATYTDGSQQDVTASALWSSSNTAVAAVSPSGFAGGTADGTATVTATVNSNTATGGPISGSATLTVSGQVTSISVTPASASIPLGTTQQFLASGTYSDGTTANLTAATWASSNPAVASASQGLATTLAQGTTTITAQVGSAVGSASLTVGPPALVSIAITPPHPSIQVSASQQLTATGTYTDKSTQDLTGSVTWSSSGPLVASISAAGSVTAAAPGVTTITATLASTSASMPLGVYSAGQARFAYVTNIGGSVSLFLVDNSTGALVPAETTPLNDNTGILDAAADPTGSFLYVTSEFNLFAFTIDRLTGSLNAIAGSPVFANTGWGLAVHPSSRFLLIDFTCCGVATYTLDSNGLPSFAGEVSANSPIYLALDPTGKFAYANNVNGNSVSAFSIDASTGQLMELAGSPFPVPGPNPESVAVYPLGGYLFLPNGNGQDISLLALDANTGGLVGQAVNYAVGQIPLSIAIDPAGKFAFVTNSASNTISAFTIDGTTGTLTPVSGSPFAASGSGPWPAAVDPLGKFLYVGDYDSNNIATFSINNSTGALTNVSSVATPGAPSSIHLVK
jgi:6-phosphogluconolactonase (cycloisomerase 2 family)